MSVTLEQISLHMHSFLNSELTLKCVMQVRQASPVMFLLFEPIIRSVLSEEKQYHSHVVDILTAMR